MSSSKKLPDIVGIFPLAGAPLFPNGRLPLHVFEPRYLRLVRDALSGSGVIGMIQPRGEGAGDNLYDLYPIGCVGEIVDVSEADNGQLDIMLNGLCRFEIAQEMRVSSPYRQVMTNYSPFNEDQSGSKFFKEGFRQNLMRVLDAYNQQADIAFNSKILEKLDDQSVLTAIAMTLPFDPAEKQAVLEARSFIEQSEILLSLMTFAIAGDQARSKPSLH